MKNLFIIPLGICLWAAICHAAPSPASKVLLAQNDSASNIAQVKAGTLKTAYASWWGFNKEDATQALQDAVNSGVPTLIVDNMGSDWIINQTINLVSNQKIIFEDGVVVQAKKDSFKAPGASLFLGNNIHDVTMEGQGHVTLRMRKSDYQDAQKYKPAEWRSGISLYDCRNMNFRNFTITQTGGDGIYLGATEKGFNQNILIEDMNFDGNHRLGMAVISAQDLTIRRCKFINTLGTPPNGGLDFEPNTPGQRLINCVVEESTFANNIQGMGVSISPANMTGDSLPISIQFKKCIFQKNEEGLSMWLIKLPTQTSVSGKVSFDDCTFDHDGINLTNVVKGGVAFAFHNCTIDFGETTQKAAAPTPIVIKTDHRVKSPVLGSITFDNVNVMTGKDQAPLQLDFWANIELSNQITGNMHVKQSGKNFDIHFPTYIEQNRKQLEVPLAIRMQKLKAQLPRFSDAEIEQNRKQIRELENAGKLKDNLVNNGDFSIAADSADLAKANATGWMSWKAWDSAGEFGIDPTINHSKVAGGSSKIFGVDRGAYQQNISVNPGESFVVQGWIRRAGQGIGSLKVGWKTTDMKWIDGSNGPTFYVLGDDPENVWQKVEGVVTAPANAAFMVFLCGATHQRFAQDQMWFDDIAVYKIDN
jgi:hypothetical protein